MVKFLLATGAIFFIGSVILIVSNYETFNVERKGKVVKMRIEDLPKSCITTVPYFVTYSYDDETYDKMTRGNFCEKHHVGELIEMKMLKGSKFILYPNESSLKSLVSFGVLGFFGVIIFITQWKKLRNEK